MSKLYTWQNSLLVHKNALAVNQRCCCCECFLRGIFTGWEYVLVDIPAYDSISECSVYTDYYGISSLREYQYRWPAQMVQLWRPYTGTNLADACLWASDYNDPYYRVILTAEQRQRSWGIYASGQSQECAPPREPGNWGNWGNYQNLSCRLNYRSTHTPYGPSVQNCIWEIRLGKTGPYEALWGCREGRKPFGYYEPCAANNINHFPAPLDHAGFTVSALP